MICFITVKLLSHPFYSITFLHSLGTGHQLPFIKTNEKPLLKFFLTLEKKIGDLVKFIDFFFHLMWNVTFKFTQSKLPSILLASFPALHQKLGLCSWSVKLLLMELDEKQVLKHQPEKNKSPCVIISALKPIN